MDNAFSPATRLRAAAVPMLGQRTVDESGAFIVDQVGTAARLGADVVVFPETATDSYQRRPVEHQAGIERWLPEIEAAVGRAAGPWVILGTYSYPGGEPRNSALVIDPAGRVRGVYDKLSEGGTRWLLLKIKGVCCTVVICADMWLPGLLTIPKMLGARVCLYPHGSGAVNAGRRDWSPLYYTRAWESEMFLVMADCSWPAGPPFARPAAVPYPYDFDHHLLNQTCLISPEPRYLARSPRDDVDGLLIADLEIAPTPPAFPLERYPVAEAWQAMLRGFEQAGQIQWLT
jgi:predicted amidohydrolase